MTTAHRQLRYVQPPIAIGSKQLQLPPPWRENSQKPWALLGVVVKRPHFYFHCTIFYVSVK